MVSLEDDPTPHAPRPLDAAELSAHTRRLGIRLTDAALADLVEATGGSTPLVRAVLRELPVGPLLTEVTPALPAVRENLQATVWPTLTASERTAARALTAADGLTDLELERLDQAAALAADALHARGLTVHETAGADRVHRPAGLLRDLVLLATARPWVLESLRADLMRTREEIGVLDCGLGDAHRRRDWQACARILDRWWPHLSFSAHRPLCQAAVFDIPHDVLRAHPVAWHRAEYLGTVDFDDVDEVIAPGTPIPTAAEEARYVLRRTSLAMTARRIHHRHDEAVEIARRAEPVAEFAMRATHGPAASISAYWYLQTGITHELAGNHDAAARMYRSGWQMRHGDELGFCGRDLAGKLAAHAAWRGRLREASHWAEVGAQLPGADHWATSYVGVGYDLAHSTIAVDRLDHGRAATLVAQGAQDPKGEEFWAHRVHVAVRHLLSAAEPFEALERLDEASAMSLRSVAGTGTHADLTNTARAETMLALGRGNLAAAAIGAVHDTRLRTPLRARIRLLCGAPDDTRALTSAALAGPTWRRQRIELLLLDAVAACCLGEQRHGIAQVRTALRLICAEGSLRALTTVPRSGLAPLAAQVPDLSEALDEIDRRGFKDLYPEQIDMVELSAREQAILSTLAEGRTLAETAAAHFVSLNTVKTQVRSLYAKLRVNTRRDLLVAATDRGLLSRPFHEGDRTDRHSTTLD